MLLDTDIIMPGLHLDFGFFVANDLSPQGLLPDKNPKVYSQYLLEDLKSSEFVQQSFLGFFRSLNLTLDDLLDAHKRFAYNNYVVVILIVHAHMRT